MSSRNGSREYTCEIRFEPGGFDRKKLRWSYDTLVLFRGEYFVLIKKFRAPNRRKAVMLALAWFWRKFKGSIGQAHKCLTVDDPYHEVYYGPQFNCADKLNRCLTESTMRRLLAEAQGELVPETRERPPHHAPGSVRRRRRRRKFPYKVAPGIYANKDGELFCRVPHISRGGKRVASFIRLASFGLKDARREIEVRNLLSKLPKEKEGEAA